MQIVHLRIERLGLPAAEVAARQNEQHLPELSAMPDNDAANASGTSPTQRDESDATEDASDQSDSVGDASAIDLEADEEGGDEGGSADNHGAD